MYKKGEKFAENAPSVGISPDYGFILKKEMALTYTLMQPSIGTINSPSSRIVKILTPSRRRTCRILRCINFGIGESSPNLFLNLLNLYLIKFETR